MKPSERRGQATALRAGMVCATLLAPCAVPAADQPSVPVPVRAIHVNSVGYLPTLAKRATVVGAEVEGFRVVDVVTGETLSTGRLGESRRHPDSDQQVRIADFTDLSRPGRYVLRVDGVPDSPEFAVRPGVYNDSLRVVMLGFYGQRCGEAVAFEHAGQRYEKQACHLDDGYLDHYDRLRAGEHRDGTGGWHDAGDYGKYVVNGAFSVGLMLKAWEHYAETLVRLELPIPERDGPLPDYLAEVRFGLDWLLKMQFPDGRVSHKLTRTDFAGMVMPAADAARRYYTPWGSAATADLAAVAAQAARVYAPFDAEYAARCRQIAERATSALEGQWQEVRPDLSAFRTGGYLRPDAGERLWALAEAWETSGDAATRERLEQRLASDNFAVDVDWDWGGAKNLAIYTYLLSRRERDASLVEVLEHDLMAAADRIVGNAGRHGYGRGLRRYYWGGNGGVARTFLTLLIAERLGGDTRYRSAASDQLAYVYGRNPFGRSFVTGDGHAPPLYPHHRPSAADGIEAPWPGHLVGGANPGERDWYDVTENYRTNENAINWDASLAYALAALYDPNVP